MPGVFPPGIALSADSLDILAYIDQPLTARKPVGYQREFLEAYEPNVSAYLPESLRRQLHQMGRTAQIDAPAGTHSRAILGRLLIDLSCWLATACGPQSSRPGNPAKRAEEGTPLNLSVSMAADQVLIDPITSLGRFRALT